MKRIITISSLLVVSGAPLVIAWAPGGVTVALALGKVRAVQITASIGLGASSNLSDEYVQV